MDNTRIFPLLLTFILLGVCPAVAQDRAGQGSLHGVVLDKDEEPLAGAEVRLSPVGSPATGAEPVVTGPEGRWSVEGLAAGRWNLVIAAEGYIRSEGWAQVGSAASAPIQVTLRPLSQVLPGYAENPGSIYAWLEKGNSLLEQGRPAEARKEYERALRFLDPDQQSEVLRAVARTHYLEQDPDAAVNALRRALLFAPRDEESRQLFTALLQGLGRGDEARTWLARLEAEGPQALASEVEQPAGQRRVAGRPPEDDEPTLPPVAGRTGAYRTAFAERSPLSPLDVYVDRHQASRSEILEIDDDAAAYDIREETFEVFVPEDYNGSVPYGLFVWVSPTASGKVGRPDSLEALAARRLIWVGANKSGNRRAIWDRVGLALDAAHAVRQLYTIDERRVYVGGYSGGGRMSTALSVLYPDVFQGGLFFMGCDYYRKVPLPDKPGAHWPAAFQEPPRSTLELVRDRNRYVFVTGEHDFNRMQTRIYHRLYQRDGFRHVTYLEIPDASHYSGFGGEWLAKFIDVLDEGVGGAG